MPNPGDVVLGHGDARGSETPASSSHEGVPPPPLPPPASLGRKRKFINPHWPFAKGWLVWDQGRNSLDGHCDDPRHENKVNPCRLNRQLGPSDKSEDKGRPFGLVSRWLEADVATQELHKNMCILKKQRPEDAAFLSEPNRLAARDRAEAMFPGEISSLERKKRGSEGREPKGLA